MAWQVVEEWDPAVYERCLDHLEAAITAACQDAIAETRTAARCLFAAYSRAWPERGKAFLARQDSALQARLAQACQDYVPGGSTLIVPGEKITV